MSTSADLVAALKSELRDAHITYAALAERIGLAESSVKRMFSRGGDMPLSRVDEICRVLGLDFADLARRVADHQPLLAELTLEQEQAVVADRRLLLVAICCLSLWSAEQIVATYRMDAAECTAHLLRLDHLGIIELRPLNRYRLRVAKGFRWRANGPVMQYFRDEVLDDYFAGGFDGEAEMLSVVHGQIGAGLANSFRERLARVCEDFARQHIVDQKLPAAQRRPYTLVIAMRSWLLAAFRDLKRDDVAWPDIR
ncbi:helix-turn-helix transcriptional regulator [Pseudothauera nasutitermitis]|uniref:Helix-turn-helix transcriptional regulator n=1 Tax=Pseudothauera nasutitermitis TaxID=2565930 RepID=A0A4S4AZ73_9RHOO|nr:helix-turn-helix transcriptional regulator [Pseudothauera nasutitermitis]THF64661.1 helix-turn-helix transcriptional regulator [Pseudothauera nasutitermitis]